MDSLNRYMNHAKLFLGWCRENTKHKGDENGKSKQIALSKDDLSIFAVLPNKEKESADNIIRFVLWLRTRDISVSYEANVLRGIIKLLKFRCMGCSAQKNDSCMSELQGARMMHCYIYGKCHVYQYTLVFELKFSSSFNTSSI